MENGNYLTYAQKAGVEVLQAIIEQAGWKLIIKESILNKEMPSIDTLPQIPTEIERPQKDSVAFKG